MNDSNDFKASSLLAVLGVIITVIILGLVVCISSYINATNYGAAIEAQLNAEYENNKNLLAQGQQKVLEAAQVPEMYRDDFSKIITADVKGRYGPDGSKATFQWLKEHDVKIDAALYEKIQQLIESYRDEFSVGQTKMIDVRRQYEMSLNFFWKGMWLRLAGFPKVDLNKFNPITTDRVEQTYKDGKEAGPMKLRQ
jgi:hypothetical protein